MPSTALKSKQFIRSFVHSIIRSFDHSFIRSFAHSLIRSLPIFYYRANPKNLFIRLGEHDLRTKSESESLVMAAKKYTVKLSRLYQLKINCFLRIINHPSGFDISIIKIDSIDFDKFKHIRPICLPYRRAEDHSPV